MSNAPQNAYIKPLLTPDDAAAYLGIATKTLENWRSTRDRKIGPAFIRISHRCVRYRESDLETPRDDPRKKRSPDGGDSVRASFTSVPSWRRERLPDRRTWT
jgi:hypothetical protein